MRVVLVPLLLTAGAMIAQPADAQTVRRTANGNLEVGFPGPCTVHYDSRGRYRYAERSCSQWQQRAADRAVGQYAGGDYGRPGLGFGNAARYRVTDIRYDRVRFADDCRVYFDRLGRYLRDRNGCDLQQRSLATREINRWRQQSGFFPGGGGWYPGGQYQDLSLTPTYDGGTHVRFRDGCDINYNAYGNRIRADNKCSGMQKARADQAVRYYGHGIRY